MTTDDLPYPTEKPFIGSSPVTLCDDIFPFGRCDGASKTLDW